MLLNRADILYPDLQYIVHELHHPLLHVWSKYSVNVVNIYISEIYFGSFLLNFRVYFQCHISILRMPTKKSPQGMLFIGSSVMPSGSLISLVTSQHDHNWEFISTPCNYIVEALAGKKL